MTIELKGPWKKDFAYDVHTLDSVYMVVDQFGHDQWNTTRSEMGELVYKLKYRCDRSVVERIVDLLGKYKGLETMDVIMPIPSTKLRTTTTQPVCLIARELGRRIKVPVLEDAIQNSPGEKELKNVNSPRERKELLREHMSLTKKHDLSGKNILLLDDLYRSGSTLSIAADMLYKEANVNAVK